MTKIIVCKWGMQPVIEEVKNPFEYTKEVLLGGGYLEAKLIVVNDKTRVVAHWDEDSKMKGLPFNRNVPARALAPMLKPEFVVDTREHPPEHYAKPGEMGYFPICGNFSITKANNKGDYVDLNAEEIATLMPLLTLPQT